MNIVTLQSYTLCGTSYLTLKRYLQIIVRYKCSAFILYGGESCCFYCADGDSVLSSQLRVRDYSQRQVYHHASALHWSNRTKSRTAQRCPSPLMSLISSELATDGTEDSASDSSVRNVRSIEVIDPDNLESASFRWSWRAQFARESRQSPGRPKEQRTDEEKCGNDQKSSSAIRIFEAGIAHEREGRMQQAIRCYKQAMKIYPDVEKMVFLNSSVTTGLSLKAIEESGLATSCRRSPDETGCTSKGEVIKNLEERLSREPKSLQCEPNEPQERTHISALPNEVILQIFRWVISSDLDVQQLEQLSLVCSRFYKLARHPQLWQSICERVWGQQLGPLAPFSSWRDMFINRCRPCFNGLYVAKITYPRMGESNCSSALYRPWHRVVYYRCLRFFPDGTATMITTADPPQAIVQHLKSKKPKCPTAKVGRYTMEKAEVVQVTFNRSLIKDDVYRQTVGSNNFVRNRQFFLVLQVKSTDRLRDNTLVLTNYEAIDHYVCGKTGPSKFRVDERNFPPFHFCPVRSYTALSEAAL